MISVDDKLCYLILIKNREGPAYILRHRDHREGTHYERLFGEPHDYVLPQYQEKSEP